MPPSENGEEIKFRESVVVGQTTMSRAEIKAVVDSLSRDYPGNTYHILTNNCNHFSADLCRRLTGEDLPAWVNRLAYLATWFPCLVPASLNPPTADADDAPAYAAFAGEGFTLGTAVGSAPVAEATVAEPTDAENATEDDGARRRRLLAEAAMARMGGN